MTVVGRKSDRVLVTGGGGFIGSRLVGRLVAQGSEVHLTSRSGDGRVADGVRRWRLDVADAEATRGTIATVEPDVVFHLASHVDGGRRAELVLPTLYGNLVSAVNVLVAVEQVGCSRVVLAGSLEEPDPDVAAAVMQSPYAVSKWAASAYARMFAALYGTPAVLLRLFMVYGPGQHDATKLVPYVTRALLAGERPRLTSGARPIDWVYVDDVVEALAAAASAPGIEGRTIDVGSGELHTVRQVVAILARLTGARVQPAFGALEDRPLEVVRAADTSAAADYLGWRAAVPLEEGLARTVDWLEAAGAGAASGTAQRS